METGYFAVIPPFPAMAARGHDRFLADLTAFLSELDPSITSGAHARQTTDDTPKKHSESATQRREQMAAKRRARHLQKRKDERCLLLRQQSELSAQLEKLLDHVMKKPRESMLLTTWKAIAKRQMERRQAAEQQYKQLRAEVEFRARFIQQLQALVEGPQIAQTVCLAPLSASKFDGTALLDSLLMQLDSLNANTSEVFRNLKLKASTTLGYSPKRKVEAGVEYFESSDAMLIPFSLQNTTKAMSSVVLSFWDGKPHENIPDPENTVAAVHNVSYRCDSGETVPYWAYVATRRYEEADRVVFVWRMVIEGQGRLAGLHSGETGWTVLRPSLQVTSSASETSPWTVSEVHTHLTVPQVRNEHSEEFMKMVLKSNEEEVTEMTRMMDTLLLTSRKKECR